MADVLSDMELLIEKVEDYGKTTTELLRLQAIEKSAVLAAELSSRIIIGITVAMCLLMCSWGLALLIGNWLGMVYYGFFIMAAFYGLLGLVFYIFQRAIIKQPISNAIITNMLQPTIL